MQGLDETDRRLLAEFQRDLPLVARPYAVMGEKLGLAEDEVIARLSRLHAEGAISRIGPVFAPNRIGCSTLVAMAVPAYRLDSVAALVSRYLEVNHNYERNHRFNLWFVVAAASRSAVDRVLADIRRRTGLEMLDLPLAADYHIDLGFELQWS